MLPGTLSCTSGAPCSTAAAAPMTAGRSHEVAVRLAGQIPIGNILPPTGEHAVVFQPAFDHLRPRECDEDAAGRVVEQGGAHRALPPARGERGVLVVPDDDEVDAEGLGEAADLLDRLAHGELPGGVEAAL